jgi:hypothetical protein
VFDFSIFSEGGVTDDCKSVIIEESPSEDTSRNLVCLKTLSIVCQSPDAFSVAKDSGFLNGLVEYVIGKFQDREFHF